MAAESIRLTPLSCLRGLARRAKAGDFKPELALRVRDASQNRRRVEAALRRAEAPSQEALAVDATTEDNPLVWRLVNLSSRLKRPGGNSR